MTVGRRYPLTALRAQRNRDARSRTMDLATAVTMAKEAAAAAEIAARRAAAAEAAASAASEAVRGLPGSGARAGDLVVAESHARQRRRHAVALREGAARAEADARDAEADVERARRALGTAKAEGELVERHHDRWRDDQRRARDRRDE